MARAVQKRTEVSTRGLLEAAADLIGEQGYERTTLVSIGQRAGYSPGLVTQRFGSKDGLLKALVQRLTTDWASDAIEPQLEPDEGIQTLAVMLRAIRESIGRDPRLTRALYALMFEAVRIPALHDDMAVLHQSLRARICTAVANARRQGEVAATVDPERFAALVVSALRGAAYQWLLDPQFPLEQTIFDLEHVVAAQVIGDSGDGGDSGDSGDSEVRDHRMGAGTTNSGNP